MFTDPKGKLRPIWAFVFSVLLAAVAFWLCGNIASEASGDHPFRRELVFRGLWTLLLFGIFIWLLTVGDHVEEHRIAAQGLPRIKGWLKQFVFGTILGLALTSLAVVPIHFLGNFHFKFLMTWQLVPNLIAVILTLLCGALGEELMFRGYPFQHLEQATGTIRAVVLFAVFYGLLHIFNPGAGAWGIANTILLGVLFSIAYLRTRALWLPWGIHFGWNAALGLLFGLPVSGFRYFNLWVYTQPYGPKWLTGGYYGVEGAATGSVAILIGLIVVLTVPLRKLPQPLPLSVPETALSSSLSSIKS